jgi:hypothetical protein
MTATNGIESMTYDISTSNGIMTSHNVTTPNAIQTAVICMSKMFPQALLSLFFPSL